MKHLHAAANIVQCYHLIAANVRAGLPRDYALHEDPDYVDIEFPAPYHKLLEGLEQPPASRVFVHM